MYNVLICYYGEYPTRTTILDHLYSFQRYSGQRCFYLDPAAQRMPAYLLQIPFDLIIFHTIFLSARWNPGLFRKIVNELRPLKNVSAVKVALPQDDFYYTSVVCDFINEFGIDHVFSAASPKEWEKIYRTVDFSKVKFHQVLTGYLEKRTLERLAWMAKTIRDLEIGYRAWRAEPWLGRHGYLKARLGEVFQHESLARGIQADISTRAEDTLHGDAWYKFLFRCKYTIGVEGGASILDWDGSIRERTNRYVAQHPTATFEEVEAACFPGLDGSLSLFALSPRHLEACATRTCQILIEGDYNGVLVPGKHYIELKRDFSNLGEVFAQLEDDALRREIVTNTYQDVVVSGKYFYENFVKQVLETSLGRIPREATLQDRAIYYWLAWQWARFANLFAWAKGSFRGRILLPIYEKIVNSLPKPVALSVRLVARKMLKK